MSHTKDSVTKAYDGLAERLFDKATAACARLDKDDAEALHDFRVALRRLRTHLETHKEYLGRNRANRMRRSLSELVSATNTSRDFEVQREWIEQQMRGERVSQIQREGLKLILTEFYGNGQNGTSRSELEPIKSRFAKIGDTFTQLVEKNPIIVHFIPYLGLSSHLIAGDTVSPRIRDVGQSNSIGFGEVFPYAVVFLTEPVIGKIILMLEFRNVHLEEAEKNQTVQKRRLRLMDNRTENEMTPSGH